MQTNQMWKLTNLCSNFIYLNIKKQEDLPSNLNLDSCENQQDEWNQL